MFHHEQHQPPCVATLADDGQQLVEKQVAAVLGNVRVRVHEHLDHHGDDVIKVVCDPLRHSLPLLTGLEREKRQSIRAAKSKGLTGF